MGRNMSPGICATPIFELSPTGAGLPQPTPLRQCASCATPSYREWRYWSGAGVHHLRTWTGASDSQVRPARHDININLITTSRWISEASGWTSRNIIAGWGKGLARRVWRSRERISVQPRPFRRRSPERRPAGRFECFQRVEILPAVDRLHSAMFCEELLRKNCPNPETVGKHCEADKMALRQVTDPRPDAGRRVLPRGRVAGG